MQPFADPKAKLLSHEAALSRYAISATLCLDQPLHIGSGQSNSETDSAVIKDHAGRPVIPGSSLRGALRARCERLADALLPGRICFLYEANSQVKCVSIKPDLLRDPHSGDLLPDDRLWAKLPACLCPSCRLFGASAFWASKLRIPDLPMCNPEQPEKVKRVRHGVGIHRDAQTAAPAIKYDQEVVMANAQFHLEILLENPDADDLSLLALGLADLAQGRLALGGNTSRGLGGCHLTAGAVAWVNLQERAQLVRYLTTGQYPQQEALQPWLTRQLQRWMEEPHAQTAGQ